MKIKCIKLLDAFGRMVEDSPWLVLGRTYHVLSIYIDRNGERRYAVVCHEREGEWPSVGNLPSECFEVTSAIAPSNWRPQIHLSSAITISPVAWQVDGFLETFFDRDPTAYPIFMREREIMLREDP